MRNYSSITAILQGLKNANICPEPQSILWTSINPTSNYRPYRVQWSRQPGLPYLDPHMRRRIPAGVVRDIFHFTTYYTWREEPEWDQLIYLCRTLWYLLFNIIPLAWSLLLTRLRPQIGWSRWFPNHAPLENCLQPPKTSANPPQSSFLGILHSAPTVEEGQLEWADSGEELVHYSGARVSHQDTPTTPVLSPATTLTKPSCWNSFTTLYDGITSESISPREDFSVMSDVERCLGNPKIGSFRSN